ncbi:MAG: DUF1588 domain-containing protein [Planctomycetota bacterium]
MKKSGFLPGPPVIRVGLFITIWLTYHSLCFAQEATNQSIPDAAKIYQAQCASCHGKNGEGKTEYFEDPLIGDLSLSELTQYIVETMPEEDPDSCIGEEAKAVAQFIYDKYYSSDAQLRNTKARIELSHLTVRQFRQSVAGIFDSFERELYPPEENGLAANYFGARNWTENKRLAEQTDPNIDYGDGVPFFDPDGNYPQLANTKKKKAVNQMNVGFSAYWTGSLIPSETGMHEIIVESKNGFRLKINDTKNDLIDRRVRSDEVVEHKATIFLMAGHPHPFALEMFSYPKPPAKIRVLWKPPGRPLSVIPETAFIPETRPEVIAPATSFPPDDSSYGFARGIGVSRSWDDATTSAAIEVANRVSERIWRLCKTKPTDPNAHQKVKDFCRKFVSRAFVTQLSADEIQFFVDQHFEKEISIQDQVKRVVILTLKSPRFLYPSAQKRDRQHQIARGLAMTLWDSVPDRRLFSFVEKNKLTQPKILDNELWRMVDHPNSREKLNSFFRFWLHASHEEAVKDSQSFPDFDAYIQADMQDSLFVFLENIVWKQDGDYRQLFLSEDLFVNPRLAKFLRLKPSAKGFEKVTVDPGKRAGVLTHPYLMTELAYHKDTSPIHRGVFVAKNLLGRRLRQPPEDVEPLTEEFDPKMTTRQRVEHQTKDTTCMNCHKVINPLGFSLENFDAVGRYRESEKDKEIDVTSIYRTPQGEQVSLKGPRDLAEFLVNNETSQKSFIKHLFSHYTKHPIEAFGTEKLDLLHSRFRQNGFNIKSLLVDIAKVSTEIPIDKY